MPATRDRLKQGILAWHLTSPHGRLAKHQHLHICYDVTELFHSLARHKTRDADSARIERLSTVFDRCSVSPDTRAIGNAWSAMHYGGEFCLVHDQPERTALSLVFVQSKDGNPGGADPGDFGGGVTDKYLIYEGLSRVAADAVESVPAHATQRPCPLQ